MYFGQYFTLWIKIAFIKKIKKIKKQQCSPLFLRDKTIADISDTAWAHWLLLCPLPDMICITIHKASLILWSFVCPPFSRACINLSLSLAHFLARSVFLCFNFIYLHALSHSLFLINDNSADILVIEDQKVVTTWSWLHHINLIMNTTN